MLWTDCEKFRSGLGFVGFGLAFCESHVNLWAQMSWVYLTTSAFGFRWGCQGCRLFPAGIHGAWLPDAAVLHLRWKYVVPCPVAFRASQLGRWVWFSGVVSTRAYRSLAAVVFASPSPLCNRCRWHYSSMCAKQIARPKIVSWSRWWRPCNTRLKETW